MIKNLSFYSGLLIYWGILKLIIYYSLFKVPIVEYIEFSEILTSFLDDFLLYAIILVLLFLTYFFLITGKLKNYTLYDIYNATKNKEKNNDQYIKIIKGLKEPSSKTTFLNSSIFIILSVLSFYFYNKFEIKYFAWIGLCCVFITIIFFMRFLFAKSTIRYMKCISPKVPNWNYLIFIAIFIFVTIIISNSAIVEVIKTVNNPTIKSLTLRNGSIIYSDSTKFFIGKTNKYIFYYNNEFSTTKVFKMDDVKELTLK